MKEMDEEPIDIVEVGSDLVLAGGGNIQFDKVCQLKYLHVALVVSDQLVSARDPL